MDRNVLTGVVLLSVVISTAGITQPVQAAEIVVEDSRCIDIKPVVLADIEKKLKAANGIAADDKIVCKVPASSSARQSNFPAANLIPAIRNLFCEHKNANVLDSCEKLSDTGARKSCQTAEKKRYSSVRKVCK